MFPWDRILDFGPLAKFHPLVPLDEPVMQFWQRMERELGPEQLHYVHHEVSQGWGEANLRAFLGNRKRILFFHGAEMYHVWWGGAKMGPVRRRLRYAKMIRRAALDLVTKAFGGAARFNAVHVRLGDYSGRTPSSAVYERRCRGARFSPDVPLYVATEPKPPRGFFDALCKPAGTFRCVFSRDLDRDVISAFKSAFPPGQIRNDMLGVVEQLVCVAARGFVGTSFSTFSFWISSMRKNSVATFPEVKAAWPLVEDGA